MESRSRPDYLIIGHVTHDLTPDGITTGGTVAYSGLTAQALGCNTCVVTSAGPDFNPDLELPGLNVHIIPAAETTTFQNIYTAQGRRQYLHHRANLIKAADIPPDWSCAPIVHLGPLDMEIDPAIIHTFPKSAIGITPQGWLRKWDESGEIRYKSWPPDAAVLSKATLLVISEEDLPPAEPIRPYRESVPILVQTRGRQGCTVYQAEAAQHFSAPEMAEVNPTGAGDIFTTAFLIRLHQTESVPEAAVFANKIAAWSVTGKTLPEKIAIIKERLQGDL